MLYVKLSGLVWCVVVWCYAKSSLCFMARSQTSLALSADQWRRQQTWSLFVMAIAILPNCVINFVGMLKSEDVIDFVMRNFTATHFFYQIVMNLFSSGSLLPYFRPCDNTLESSCFETFQIFGFSWMDNFKWIKEYSREYHVQKQMAKAKKALSFCSTVVGLMCWTW